MAALLPCIFWWEMWTSVTKPLGTASTWEEWYPLMLSKNVMLWTRLISAPSVSRAVRASVLLETCRGTQTRNNAIISLFPTRENKLLSHQTFEITEKYMRRAALSSASRAHLLPCRPAGCLLCSPGAVAHRPHIFLVFGRCNVQVSDPSLRKPVSALAERGCFYTCRKPLTPAKSLLSSPVTAWGQTWTPTKGLAFNSSPARRALTGTGAACLQPVHACSAG